MRSKTVAITTSALVLLALFMVAQRGMGQSSQARLITQGIDESKMMVLKGNTYPLARAQYDRGAVSPSLPMERMLLVMKRSPAQESALETFLAQQLDKTSPNFHKWLTPDQFGERFGASQEDIAQVTSWLQSHGFQIGRPSHGRGIIEFSGNAGQVQAAFRTAIHSYNVNGAQYWANESDPQIPQALAPAVAGVLSLHNFPKHAMSHSLGRFRRNMATAKADPVQPSFTFNGGCVETNCFALGPADFATIYNLGPLYSAGIDGTGEVIAVVGDSNINPTDVAQFRSIFGLPAKAPNIIVNGTDPGLTGDETEALVDVEWSGAVAKNATIDFVVSETGATFGGDLSAQFIVDNNLAPIMSESFGECELFLGTTGNSFYNSLYTQAVAQGITIAISTGDSGAVGCIENNSADPNQFGFGVNGVGSTPFNVAVGGTDFDDFNNSTPFWNTSNAAGTGASAKSYIPETTWNDSCTNANLSSPPFSMTTNPETNCNNTTSPFATEFITLNGGSGGVSNCTMPTGATTSTCAGGYAKPSWQVGVGVPADGHRDLPDVSMFASTGAFSGSFYVICEQDDPMNQDGAACSLTADNFSDFSGVGGTSVSTQVFAGVLALLDQKAKGPQGNVNPMFYTLAASQAGQCATATIVSGTACVFYDVSKGTNVEPCLTGTQSCSTTNGADANGILTGFSAGTGYDLVTGLGSFNAFNLVQAFAGAVSAPSFTVGPPSGTATVTAGSSTTYPVTVTGTGGFAGTVSFTCSGPAGSGITCTATSATLSATTTTADATLTIMAPAAANVTPQAPGANGTPNRYAPLFAGNSQRVLGAISTMILFLCGALFLFAPKHRKSQSAAVFALMVFGLLFTASCGGGGGSGGGGGGGGVTPPPATNTATVLVTGTSGSVKASTTVTLTIQ